MLRHLALASLGCALSAPVTLSAQAGYDFNGLMGSDVRPYTLLDQQDNWSEQTFRAANRCGVTATLSHDMTQCLRFEEVGPGYGCDASRLNDSNWSFGTFLGNENSAFFEADMLVSRWKKEGVRITGTVKASIVQLCVVTLEPLTSHVEAEIDSLFVPEQSRLSRVADGHGEIIIDVEGDDLPEPFEGNEIDAGALAEEHFELTIDPYPRKPGAALDGPAGDPLPERENPFAKLASLRKDEGK